MDISIGIALVLLMTTFIIIAIFYFRRQAVALENVAEIEEERYMRQTKLWRKQDAEAIRIDDPKKWFQEQAVIALRKDIELLGDERKNSSPPVIEFTAGEGQRVVFSPLDLKAMKKAFPSVKPKGDSPISRAQRLEGDTPFLGRNPRSVEKGNVSLRDDEWFDLRANKAASKLGVSWGEPTRIWVYLVK